MKEVQNKQKRKRFREDLLFRLRWRIFEMFQIYGAWFTFFFVLLCSLHFLFLFLWEQQSIISLLVNFSYARNQHLLFYLLLLPGFICWTVPAPLHFLPNWTSGRRNAQGCSLLLSFEYHIILSIFIFGCVCENQNFTNLKSENIMHVQTKCL